MSSDHGPDPTPHVDCACGTVLHACAGCGEPRCYSCDPSGDSDCDYPSDDEDGLA